MTCNCTSCTIDWLVGEGRHIVADALIKKLQIEEQILRTDFIPHNLPYRINISEPRISIERALQSEYFDDIEVVEQWREKQQ